MIFLKNFISSKRNKHRAMTIGYAVAIVLTFLFSIMKNSDVNASISYKDQFDYSALESRIQENALSSAGFYGDGRVENIKNIFDMFAPKAKEKVISEEIVIEKGDTLTGILTKTGLEYSEANAIYMELKKVYDVRNLRIGQKIEIKKLINIKEETFLGVVGMVIPSRVDERFIVEKNEEGKYLARVEKDELLEEINSAAGEISGNLSSAMSDAGIPKSIVADFINIFAFSVDFRRDVKKGDKFEIIYENFINPDGQVVKTGNILFASLTLRRDKIALFRYEDKKGDVDYYDEKGLAMKKTLHRKPMAYQNARISSPFGKRRHPIYKDIRIHWGVDYAAPKGTAIYAAGDGVVQVAKYNGGYGNYVKIRHNDRYSSAYGHMNGYAKGIKAGVRVKQGQVIGYVGNTGKSTGPHLHYEVIQDGRRVNPLTIKASAGENLKGEKLESFRSVVASIKEAHKHMFADSGEATVASAQ